MSEIVLAYRSNPGASGANLAALYFTLAGQPAYVGNDGVEHVIEQGVSLSVNNTFTKAQTVAPVNLGNTGNISVNLSLSNIFEVGPLTGNITMLAPTGGANGQVVNFVIKQGTAGNFTCAWNAAYLFPGGNDPVLTVTANAVDLVSGIKSALTGNSLVCAFSQNLT